MRQARSIFVMIFLLCASITSNVHAKDYSCAFGMAEPGRSRAFSQAELTKFIDPRNWRTSLDAVEGLSAYHSEGKVRNVLEKVNAGYWHPAVRMAAGLSLQGKKWWAHDSENPLENIRHPVAFYCEHEKSSGRKKFNTQALRKKFNTQALRKKFNAEAFLDRLGVKNEEPPVVGTIFHGWDFLGTDNGEFGGKLTASKPGQVRQAVLGDSIKGLYSVGDALFVVAGVEHMLVDHGVLYRVTQSADGNFRVDLVTCLTGDPKEIQVSPDGTLAVSGNQGSMMIHPDGRLEWLGCVAPSSP